MGLDSITQTLSNPDCGLSKPHIPDNTPYISHRLIHSNRQGPHPQIYHMTCLSFSLTIATICLLFFWHRTLLFPLVALALSVPLCVFHLSFIFISLVVSIYSVCSVLISPISVPPSFIPLSLSIPHCFAIFIVVWNSKLWRSDYWMLLFELFSHLYAFCHPQLQYTHGI